jgi:hypothetical protein
VDLVAPAGLDTDPQAGEPVTAGDGETVRIRLSPAG